MKYHFDKSSRKFFCPNCNKKRFVRFVNAETNEYLEDTLGKCDRASSCGYFKKPDDTLASLLCSSAKTDCNNAPLISYHSKEVLQSSQRKYYDNNFYLYLIALFGKEKVQEVFKAYNIGTSKNWKGATIFWQVDSQNNIRGGKILLYDVQNCKRVKHPYNHISWVHSKLKIENFYLQQCLFGLHLLNSNKKIALVEAEKTSVIMALFMPEYIWIATGSKQNFKSNILEPLKGREVIAFPDKCEFADWLIRANQLNTIGFNITVSDYIEKMDCVDGTDLADLYIEIHNQPEIIELSKDELFIKNIASVNPEIYNLIETFGLCDSFDNLFDVKRMKK
jgi:hypothetical protein